MFYSNPLEPRIPVRPPWASYAETESNWTPTAGLYVTPFWKLAASFAGGQAVSRSKISLAGEIATDPAVVVAINPVLVKVQVDPDAAYVINQAYNTFRLQIVRNLDDYPNQENFEKSLNKKVTDWMVTHIEGLYQLLLSYIKDEPDIDKPLVMLSKFAGKEAAFQWFSQMVERRGTKVPAPYVELSPEFIGYATKMYYIGEPVNSNAVLEIVGVDVTETPGEVIFQQETASQQSTAVFHGTTLSVVKTAFPELVWNEAAISRLTAEWKQFLLQQDLEKGEAMREMMEQLRASILKRKGAPS